VLVAGVGLVGSAVVMFVFKLAAKGDLEGEWANSADERARSGESDVRTGLNITDCTTFTAARSSGRSSDIESSRSGCTLDPSIELMCCFRTAAGDDETAAG